MALSSCADYAASKRRVFTNEELDNILERKTAEYCFALFQQVPTGTEMNHGNIPVRTDDV